MSTSLTNVNSATFLIDLQNELTSRGSNLEVTDSALSRTICNSSNCAESSGDSDNTMLIIIVAVVVVVLLNIIVCYCIFMRQGKSESRPKFDATTSDFDLKNSSRKERASYWKKRKGQNPKHNLDDKPFGVSSADVYQTGDSIDPHDSL